MIWYILILKFSVWISVFCFKLRNIGRIRKYVIFNAQRIDNLQIDWARYSLILSFWNSWRLNPVREFLIHSLELSLTHSNIVSWWNFLRPWIRTGRLKASFVYGKADRTRVVAVNLLRLVAVMLRQNWAHLKVCNSHLLAELLASCLLRRVDCSHLLPAHVERNGFLICLGYCHHGDLALNRAKIDIRLGILFFQFHRISLKTAIGLTNKSWLSFWCVCARLSKVNWIRMLGQCLLLGDLPAVPLSLADLIVRLALSGHRQATTVNILDREVAFLNFFFRIFAFGGSLHESIGRRGYVHGSRARLVDWLISAESEMTRAEILGLLCDFLAYFRVSGPLLGSYIISILISALLERSQRLIIAFWAIVANLYLMDVRCTFFGHSVKHYILPRQFVGRIRALGSFKLISLLEAHLEVVLALSGHLQVHLAFVIYVFGWLLHAALVFWHIV